MKFWNVRNSEANDCKCYFYIYIYIYIFFSLPVCVLSFTLKYEVYITYMYTESILNNT
jgi:hypothetical protein